MTQGPWGAPPEPRKAPRLGLVLWLSAMVLLGLTLVGLNYFFPSATSPLADFDTVYLIGFLVLLSSSLLAVRQMNMKQTVRNILLWLAVGGAILIGFVYQDTFIAVGQRLRSAVIPGHAIRTGSREMIISESEGGHYMVYGEVNGVRVRFLIDTGASDIVLAPGDAKRAGIDISGLGFHQIFESANGIGRGATTTVATLSVGDISFSKVTVSVNQAPMSSSLLGMAFLRRLKSFEMGGHQLKLRW